MNGMPFMQTAHAVDVTRLGARLVDLFCLPEIGEITVQHGSQKARYKIAWTGTMGGAEAGQVGLRLVEQKKNIWGKSLSHRPANSDEMENSEHANRAAVAPATDRTELSRRWQQQQRRRICPRADASAVCGARNHGGIA